jgi:hypothetical protein
MECMPNKSKAMGSNPTRVHFHYLVYFSDLHFLLIRIIIGLAFGPVMPSAIPMQRCAKMERLTLRKKIDSQDRVPCYLLAVEMPDRSTSEEPVVRLPIHKGDAPQILEVLIFFLLTMPSLSLHRPTWGQLTQFQWISHLAVSLNTGNALTLLT